jgi:ABC-type phosphonate transport system ATPase subunit
VPTLSGGEAQRLKLAGHLVDADSESGETVPVRRADHGLHFDDVAKLLRAFRQLLDAGHSLVVIEHNLDVIRLRLDHRPRPGGRRRRRSHRGRGNPGEVSLNKIHLLERP